MNFSPVTMEELEAAIINGVARPADPDDAPLALDKEMAAIEPDPVRWVELLEAENLRLTEELSEARACIPGYAVPLLH